MHRYCLDTSWISSPLLEIPPDVHVTLWRRVQTLIMDKVFCWNTEIAEELLGSIPEDIGNVISSVDSDCRYEIGDDSWDWNSYLEEIDNFRNRYRSFISEYNGNRKKTIGLNDCSIVCLAKILKLPVASMEIRPGQRSDSKMRIPELCEREGVAHFNFNELLRAEKITV